MEQDARNQLQPRIRRSPTDAQQAGLAAARSGGHRRPGRVALAPGQILARTTSNRRHTLRHEQIDHGQIEHFPRPRPLTGRTSRSAKRRHQWPAQGVITLPQRNAACPPTLNLPPLWIVPVQWCSGHFDLQRRRLFRRSQCECERDESHQGQPACLHIGSICHGLIPTRTIDRSLDFSFKRWWTKIPDRAPARSPRIFGDTPSRRGQALRPKPILVSRPTAA